MTTVLTPGRDFGRIALKAGRTEDLEFELYDADGSPLAIAADDTLRFKITTIGGSTPTLDLDDVAATANGSVITVAATGSAGVTPASGTIRLAQGDTSALAGDYWAEMSLVDNSETAPADAIKPIMEGVIRFGASQGGVIDLTS